MLVKHEFDCFGLGFQLGLGLGLWIISRLWLGLGLGLGFNNLCKIVRLQNHKSQIHATILQTGTCSDSVLLIIINW